MGRGSPNAMRRLLWPVLVGCAALLTACGGQSSSVSPSGGSDSTGPTSTGPAPTGGTAPGTTSPGSGSSGSPGSTTPAVPGGYSQVLLIAEENEPYSNVIGDPAAPYITSLSNRFGLLTHLDAGYPASCPSLAAYLIMTSGDRHGVCDDRSPVAHQISGPNIYQQVAQSGRQWRGYAESMPMPCYQRNTSGGRYLVRHAPAPYFTSEAGRCRQWDVPMGTPTAGALHDDVASGSLPAFSFVTPDACHDMHGGPACSGDMVAAGDSWLSTWLPQIMAGPDYQAGRLAIVVTWDEGTKQDNHIPALVISPTTTGIALGTPVTQCALVRTMQEVLGVPPLGCAASAPSLRQGLRL